MTDIAQHYATLDDYVGHTPLVRLQRMAAHTQATVLATLEGNNPAGSVKDRPALSMIQRAEELKAHNRQLLKSEKAWREERAHLIEKNEMARHKVESMISRLKALEQD